MLRSLIAFIKFLLSIKAEVHEFDLLKKTLHCAAFSEIGLSLIEALLVK